LFKNNKVEKFVDRIGAYDEEKNSLPNVTCHSSCKACGYSSQPTGKSDCIECNDGFTHYPIYGDNTGACIPKCTPDSKSDQAATSDSKSDQAATSDSKSDQAATSDSKPDQAATSDSKPDQAPTPEETQKKETSVPTPQYPTSNELQNMDIGGMIKELGKFKNWEMGVPIDCKVSNDCKDSKGKVVGYCDPDNNKCENLLTCNKDTDCEFPNGVKAGFCFYNSCKNFDSYICTENRVCRTGECIKNPTSPPSDKKKYCKCNKDKDCGKNNFKCVDNFCRHTLIS
jgi:hypothetical protein